MFKTKQNTRKRRISRGDEFSKFWFPNKCFFFIQKNLVCINFVLHSSLLSTSPADNSWLLFTFYCYCSAERADVAMSGIFDFFIRPNSRDVTQFHHTRTHINIKRCSNCDKRIYMFVVKSLEPVKSTLPLFSFLSLPVRFSISSSSTGLKGHLSKYSSFFIINIHEIKFNYHHTTAVK